MGQTEDDFLPIRALNDLLFCPRRCALHRVEQVWVENAHTLEGTHRHRRAHADAEEDDGDGVRRVRGLWLRSSRLRLVGKADVVEFHATGEGNIPYPVEYKRGRKRRWDNDDVQPCAQALCLEEMLGVAVPAGAIYHVKTRSRREVAFDASLRAQTEDTARRLHELIASARTPLPVYKARCRGCSVRELCFPQTLQTPERVREYCRGLFVAADA
jgi:CRISPR-associated exonuclease Cas4